MRTSLRMITYAFDNEQDLLKVVQTLNDRGASYSIDLRDLSIRITELEASIHGFFSILPDKYKCMAEYPSLGGTT